MKLLYHIHFGKNNRPLSYLFTYMKDKIIPTICCKFQVAFMGNFDCVPSILVFATLIIPCSTWKKVGMCHSANSQFKKLNNALRNQQLLKLFVRFVLVFPT